ncbi:hypothetical protein [Pseudomonas plecoglossicida]|uniref:hypothetical protein n=1 Tax=Pseudomonas plecoglossicida TaxID=70775 RepID=UPI003D238F2D
MEKFYSWRHVKHCATQGSVEVLSLCYNRCDLSPSDVYDDVDSALKGEANLPDCVYIFGDSNQLRAFQEAWAADSPRRTTMLKRGEKSQIDFVRQYVFNEWQGADFTSHVLGDSAQNLSFSANDLLERGVFSLLQRNNAVHKAPSGHIFKHPSGTKNRVFIQARDIASGEAELFVVGYCIALRHSPRLRVAKKIYIDTMGIYAFVKNALSLCGGDAEIHSFHSYDELEKLIPPTTPYFCVVSASTTGRMAAKMRERWFSADCILTLVDVTKQSRVGDVLVSLNAMGLALPELGEKEGTLIEIIGENFSSKAKPPRSVVIGIKHTPGTLETIHEHFGFTVPPLNSPVDGGRSKLIQLDPQHIFNKPDFVEWLDDEINWRFPITTNLVIHAADDNSSRLAGVIVEKLQEKRGSDRSIKLIAAADLLSTDCSDVTGVVVVAAVSRDGGVLREISRDLRTRILSNIPRQYVTPIGIPQSAGAWKQLGIFLERNPTDRLYGFSNWINMPIGEDTEQSFWSQLSALGSQAQMLSTEELRSGLGIPDTVVTQSVDMATGEIETASQALMRSPRSKPLKLSEGFLFFKKDSAIAEEYVRVSQSTVYLTLSAVLQYAREHENPSLRLCPNGYESVVLGPECFLRFNDSILQACLLRASLPSELDYSASPELSRLMREFLSKVFIRCNEEYGDAGLEFAAALAIGRLRLVKNDVDALLNENFQRALEGGEPSALLGMLILARYQLQ